MTEAGIDGFTGARLHRRRVAPNTSRYTDAERVLPVDREQSRSLSLQIGINCILARCSAYRSITARHQRNWTTAPRPPDIHYTLIFIVKRLRYVRARVPRLRTIAHHRPVDLVRHRNQAASTCHGCAIAFDHRQRTASKQHCIYRLS